jgi:hypothetical protein
LPGIYSCIYILTPDRRILLFTKEAKFLNSLRLSRQHLAAAIAAGLQCFPVAFTETVAQSPRILQQQNLQIRLNSFQIDFYLSSPDISNTIESSCRGSTIRPFTLSTTANHSNQPTNTIAIAIHSKMVPHPLQTLSTSTNTPFIHE